MSRITTAPDLIDINLLSSIDLHANLTDYVNVLEEYVNESAVNSIYWHTYAHSDPTTSKIEFFKQIATDTLLLKDNPDGVKKREVTAKELHNKNYRDQLPMGVNLKTSGDGKYGDPSVSGTTAQTYKNVTTKEWVNTQGESAPEAKHDVGMWEIKNTIVEDTENVQPLSKTQQSNPQPDASYGMNKMSAWFKLWWIEKFNTSHQVVKRDLKEALGEGNIYFTNFSESVGQLKNIQTYYDNCTLPIWDTEFSMGIPTTDPGIARYCMKQEALTFSKNLSYHTNKLYRENMKMMMEDASKDILETGPVMYGGGMSHGSNLVTDKSYINKVVGALTIIHLTLQTHLLGLYDVLNLLSDRENYMVVNKPKEILIKVEEFTTSVDRLKRRIQSYSKQNNLGPTPKFGKSGAVNPDRTNAQKLGVPGVKESPTLSDFFS